MTTGFVSLVGAGPGDPELLTRRALQRLETADVVYYDGLVPRAIVQLARVARRVSVARRVGLKTRTQRDVTLRLIASARAGHRVVRLKSGNPFVFGRGGEEAEALTRARIRFEVVPGLTSAIAAPALAGIPVTRRGVSSVVVILSGHAPDAFAPTIERLTPGSATVVVLMGLGHRRDLQQHLLRAGWPARTAVAVVTNASRPTQAVWRGDIATMSRRLHVTTPRTPGVIVVGDVAGRVYGRTR